MAAKDDYIPTNDAEFGNWITNFLAGLDPSLLMAFGVDPMEMAPMTSVSTTFKTDVMAKVEKQAIARAAVAKKNGNRSQF